MYHDLHKLHIQHVVPNKKASNLSCFFLMGSMYGIHTYLHLVDLYGKCRQINHTLILWVCLLLLSSLTSPNTSKGWLNHWFKDLATASLRIGPLIPQVIYILYYMLMYNIYTCTSNICKQYNIQYIYIYISGNPVFFVFRHSFPVSGKKTNKHFIPS